jgi:thiol-disulfide isomerase/thioredoxin
MIVLDPARLDRRPSTFSLRFRGAASPVSRQYALWAAWQEERGEYFDSARAAYARHDSLRYDWGPVVARRLAALAGERDPLLRQMLLLQLLDAAQFDATLPREVAQRIVREVPPSSPLWSDADRTPWMIQQAFEIAFATRTEELDSAAARATLAYLVRVAAEHPDSNQQSMALYGALRIARSLNDQARVSDYYARLVDGYPYAPITPLARARMSPRRVWRVSASPPAFRFPALDDTTVTYTQASFPAKVVLVDFWATWCGPCVGDMPYVHAAHDSLRSSACRSTIVPRMCGGSGRGSGGCPGRRRTRPAGRRTRNSESSRSAICLD